MSINLRNLARGTVTRIRSRVEQGDFGGDSAEIEQLTASLERAFERFVQEHYGLVAAAANDKELVAHEELYVSVEDAYTEAAIRLKRASKKLMKAELAESRDDRSVTSDQSFHPCQQGLMDTRMSPIEIPKFDGEEVNWLRFRDLFEALVHNKTTMDDACKLARLTQHVDASKVRMIGGVYTGGYEDVWKQLKERYDRQRKLIQAHMNCLLRLKDHPQESKTVMREVVDQFRNYIRAMKVLELPTEQWDAVLYPILMMKIPVEAAAYFDRTNRGDDIPKLDEMLRVLEDYAETVTSPSPGALVNKPVKVHVVKSSNGSGRSCFYCDGPHVLRNCTGFKELSNDRRMEFVREKQMCFNCFGVTHSSAECKHAGCKRCGQKHHELLCRRGSQPASQEQPLVAPQVIRREEPTVTRTFSLRQREPVLLETALEKEKEIGQSHEVAVKELRQMKLHCDAVLTDVEELEAERRPVRSHVVKTSAVVLDTVRRSGDRLPLVERVKSSNELLYVTALVLRGTAAGKEYRRRPVISAKETDNALKLHFRQAQGMYFGHKLRQLQQKKSLTARCAMLPLNPFLDGEGIIRVGGRRKNVDLRFDRRLPMLLPQEQERRLCELIIEQGLQFIRKRIWIINGRTLVKTAINRCGTCKLHQQRMTSREEDP